VAVRHVIPPDGIPWRLRVSPKAVGSGLLWAIGLALAAALLGHH
jgi:hypothetical protein